jgi:hypothetical protein
MKLGPAPSLKWREYESLSLACGSDPDWRHLWNVHSTVPLKTSAM